MTNLQTLLFHTLVDGVPTARSRRELPEQTPVARDRRNTRLMNSEHTGSRLYVNGTCSNHTGSELIRYDTCSDRMGSE